VTPILAYPAHAYDSYTDFRRLVELAGFEAVTFDRIDPDRPGATYIVSPINRTLPRWSGRRAAKFVYWNLERPDVDTVPFWDLPGLGIHASADSVATQFDEIWVSDRFLAGLDARYRYVTLASDARLADGEPQELAYDLCHLSYVWGRRSGPIGQLEASYKVGPNGWGRERAKTLRSSRMIVNIHQTPSAVMEPLRFALAAAYHLPVISEHMSDPHPLRANVHFVSRQLEAIGSAVHEMLQFPQELKEFGERLHRELCVIRTFKSEVLKAIGE